MKTTNNYEAPVAEMIEMHMPVVLANSGTATPTDPNNPFQPGPNP